MAQVKMRQETAIKHFLPIGSENNMVDAYKTDSELLKKAAIEQHQTREESTEYNTTIFIKQSAFKSIIDGTYCAENAEPVEGEPKQIERYLMNSDSIAKVTTRKGIDGHTVTNDLVGENTGSSTFQCKFENGEWLIWHFEK